MIKTYLDTLALGQRDPGLLLSNDEDVGLTGGEGVVNGVLDVDDVETSVVALTVGDDTDTTHVTTTSDHGDNTSVEADEVNDLAGGNVDLDSVVDLDGGVGVADAARPNMLALPVPTVELSYCRGKIQQKVRREKFFRPPPINQSLVQRLNDTELRGE